MTKLAEKTVDVISHTMIYGRKIFDDGKVVPYCKPTENFKAGYKFGWIKSTKHAVGRWGMILKDLPQSEFQEAQRS